VGWNQISRTPEGEQSRLLRGVPNESFVYFTHSYRAPVVEGVSAVTNYGETFASAVERENVFGVQFHPEKSGDTGLRILQNFCDIAAEYAADRSAR
jgi:glutamine amidotransferase